MRATRSATWQRFVALAFAASLGLAVLLNGAGVFLKRVGFADRAAYSAYWAHHCIPDEETPARAAESQCAAFTTPAAIERAAAGPVVFGTQFTRYVYEMTAKEQLAKLVKDAVVLIFAAVSLGFILRGEAAPLSLRRGWPIGCLAAYLVVAVPFSIAANGWVITAAGLRAFSFVGVALVARWVAPHLGAFARALVLVLVAQALLAPLELVRGIHMSGDWLTLGWARRIAGTLVQPTSLAIFCAAALAFWMSFSPRRHGLSALAAVALALTIATGSATGLVCLGVMIFLVALENVPRDRRAFVALAGIGLLATLALALPEISGREDLFASIWSNRGRLAAFEAAFVDHSPAEILWGRGLGVNTNLTLNLMGAEGENALRVPDPITALPADSTITALVAQVGVFGTLAFYGIMLWAALRDPKARLFYVATSVASLTINVTELFPVNAMLGLAWARSAALPTGEHKGEGCDG